MYQGQLQPVVKWNDYFSLAVYYVIEQSFKIVAKGKKYFFDWRWLYEGVISLALLSIEMAQLVVYGGQTTR